MVRLGAMYAKVRDPHPVALDVLLAFVLAVIGVLTELVPDPQDAYHDGNAFSVVLALVATLPLVWRRTHPAAVMGTVVAAALVHGYILFPGAGPFLGLVAALYAVAAYGSGRAARISLAGVLAVQPLAVFHSGDPNFNSWGDAAVGAVIFTATWVFGDSRRVRRLQLEMIEERAARAERERDEQARLAVREERTRIAREMHDIVAHSVSVMVVQAGAARRLVDRDPGAAVDAAGEVETTGRAALREMRRVLGVLRTDDSDHPDDAAVPPVLEPQPGLGDVTTLVTKCRDAGLDVAGAHGRRGASPAVGRRARGLPHHPGGLDQHDEARRARPCRDPGDLRRRCAHGRGRRRRARARAGATRQRSRSARHAGTGRDLRRRPGRGCSPGRRLPRASPPAARAGSGTERQRSRVGALMAAPIRVLVADDQELVRTGFRMILQTEDDIEVVGQAADGLEAVELARRHEPDVVLMDVRMPNLDGIEATGRLVGPLASPPAPVRVLMLTTFDLDDYVYAALRNGASGFLLKDTPPEDLVRAIRIVASGEALLAPTVTRRLIEEFSRAPAPAAPPEMGSLTDREREVLGLVARGLSNGEIAAELILGETTVKTHVGRILMKLGLRDRVQAVVLAYESGLVTPGR